MPAARPITVYSSSISGHSHRVRLFLSLLDLPFEVIEVALLGFEPMVALPIGLAA